MPDALVASDVTATTLRLGQPPSPQSQAQMHPRLRTTYRRRAVISMKWFQIVLEMPSRVHSHHSHDVAVIWPWADLPKATADSGASSSQRRASGLKRWSLTEPNLTPPRRNRRCIEPQIHVDSAPATTGRKQHGSAREGLLKAKN